MKIRLIIAALFFLSAQANANPIDDLQTFRNHGNQLSEDLITCTAFFMISAQGGKNRGTPSSLKLAKNLEYQAVMAMMLAQSIADSIGQKPEVVKIRLEAIMQSIMDEMNWNYINYSIISHKYLNNCAELLRDPEKTIASRLGIFAKDGGTAPIAIQINPFTKAVAEHNGLEIKVYRISIADGRILLVPSISEHDAISAAEAWAIENPLR